MARRRSVTPFMAETTTTTCDASAIERTRPAAWSMRSAPSNELPPNLHATTDSRALADPMSSPGRRARLLSGTAASCAFSGLMTAAPLGVTAGATLEGAGKKKPTARFASGGGLETFSSLLAVSPRTGSGNGRRSRSRGSRHGQRLGGNSLSGGGYHTERKYSTAAVWRKANNRRYRYLVSRESPSAEGRARPRIRRPREASVLYFKLLIKKYLETQQCCASSKQRIVLRSPQSAGIGPFRPRLLQTRDWSR